MARRRARPADPEAIARRAAAERASARDPVTWGLSREALELPANAAVSVHADFAGRPRRVQRQDVFALLLARGGLTPAAHQAVRRLQADLARLHASAGGVAAYRESIDHVRTIDGPADQALMAGGRIRAVLDRTGPTSAALIMALVEGEAVSGAPANWRETVRARTGEALADAQGAVVRAACDNLAAAYASLDRARQRLS